jgi:ribosomal protein S18 acetylase RimI-like enzyme
MTSFRAATLADLDAIVALENSVFSSDRLSRRSFRHWLTQGRGDLWLACDDQTILGYVLVIYHRGTRLARLYSLAVAPEARGQGLGRKLVRQAESLAQQAGRLFLRLEVRRDNAGAIALYESMGYQLFGELADYYEDHQDALRYQKLVRHMPEDVRHLALPWIRQSTPFTCGPACLMMAMAALDDSRKWPASEELQIWREATTIFMTAGHGGSHPLGLALAARTRGFQAEVWINRHGPLFVDSVRGEDKKQIVRAVDRDFRQRADDTGIPLHYADISQDTLVAALDEGAVPLMLISTWRMDRKKAPHWVVISGYDERCFYVHDPDPDANQSPLDCQFMPIDREELSSMSAFGRARLRTAVIIRRTESRA